MRWLDSAMWGRMHDRLNAAAAAEEGRLDELGLIYEDWITRVRRAVPPERLLEFNVKQVGAAPSIPPLHPSIHLPRRPSLFPPLCPWFCPTVSVHCSRPPCPHCLPRPQCRRMDTTARHIHPHRAIATHGAALACTPICLLAAHPPACPQGWSPLCQFLGIETPAGPFPRVNSGGTMRVLAHGMRFVRLTWQVWLALLARWVLGRLSRSLGWPQETATADGAAGTPKTGSVHTGRGVGEAHLTAAHTKHA